MFDFTIDIFSRDSQTNYHARTSVLPSAGLLIHSNLSGFFSYSKASYSFAVFVMYDQLSRY